MSTVSDDSGVLTVIVRHAGGTITIRRDVDVVSERTMGDPVERTHSDEAAQMRVAGLMAAAALEAQP